MYKTINSQIMTEAVDDMYDAAEDMVEQIKAKGTTIETNWLDNLTKDTGKMNQYDGLKDLRKGSVLTNHGIDVLNSMNMDPKDSIYGQIPTEYKS